MTGVAWKVLVQVYWEGEMRLQLLFGIKWSKYLVRCHHIHVLRSEIPMYNVINMKVVKRGRHLRHNHDYVPMFASPVKNVFLQVTIRAHLWDLKSRKLGDQSKLKGPVVENRIKLTQDWRQFFIPFYSQSIRIPVNLFCPKFWLWLLLKNHLQFAVKTVLK